MRRIIYYTLLPVLLFFGSLWVISYTSHASSKRGYQELTPVIQALSESGKTTLAEFFSYGCPACYSIEPTLTKWLDQHKSIAFQRVPSVFRSEWEIYAKAYYVAKHFGISEKITPALFKAIHDEKQDLSTPNQMADFFAKQGIDKKQFEAVFNFAPQVAGQVSRADALFHKYKIFAIPSFVINGKYLTNADMTGGNNQKLFEVIEKLTSPSFEAPSKN
jgi:protein dithiol oxidoreductase (disulfide-forming)